MPRHWKKFEIQSRFEELYILAFVSVSNALVHSLTPLLNNLVTAEMSVQGAADTVKDTVEAVAEKVQQATIGNKDGAASAEGSTPNLLLDEVTGEMVSKSELKKRQKQREREAKKAEAAATKQAPPPPKRKAGSAVEDEAKLNPNVSSSATMALWQ